MDDLQIEELKRACVIISEGFQRVADALGILAAALGTAAANAMDIDPQAETWDDDKCDTIADLRRRLEEMYALHAKGEFTEMAEVSADIPPPKKIPRPPKRLGPVNKENYAANRPLRMARSNCRNIKH